MWGYSFLKLSALVIMSLASDLTFSISAFTFSFSALIFSFSAFTFCLSESCAFLFAFNANTPNTDATRKSTKAAVFRANVRVIDIPVDDVRDDAFGVKLSAYRVSRHPDSDEIIAREQIECFLPGQHTGGTLLI